MGKRVSQRELRLALGFTASEWYAVQVAAKDCHLDVQTWCRIMLLCSSGQGAVIECCEQAVAASVDAEVRGNG